MESFAVAAVVSLFFTGILVWANEKHRIFAGDRFPSTAARWGAYAWLAAFVMVVAGLVVESSRAGGDVDLQNVSFWSLFVLHVLLLVFLAGWWALSGRPSIASYINLRSERPAEAIGIGLAVGVGGWVLTIGTAVAIGAALSASGLLPEDIKPSPMIPWMAALPLWKKALIVFSAMTVEEAFFRGWLQKRVGLILSTIVFAIAHAGYGQPFMLIGVTIISLVIGWTFYRTRNLWPCIIAHGVFDAIQLFVIVPTVLKFSGQQ